MLKLFTCGICGNLVELIDDRSPALSCCGETMTELVPGSTDAAQEKHVPVLDVSGDVVTVTVGSVAHPMLPEHFIQWIWLVTERCVLRRALSPGDEPKAAFTLAPGDKALAAYEFCNLHGLWKKDA